MNILIVDDLLNNRKLLRDHLKPYGNCDMVSNGMEAIEMFEAELVDGTPYDLILLDIMMPELNGQDVLKEIRRIERNHNIPEDNKTIIIMVTAVDSNQNILKAFYQGGCNDYIVKPFMKEDLIKKLQLFKLI
ncbi:MAG: response regulator [Magnetococcus sp. YQC-5]